METYQSSCYQLLDLPEIVVEKILSYFSYEELAHLRIVCRRFNQINQMLLNKGFRKVERFQAKCLREVKSKLPRRESERRNHPLHRHCDILTAIETRLSLLSMTFVKYVDCSMCCFIPGKVIDEIYRVLRIVQSSKTLPRAHEILTEMRDISSMAMEHFEEKIIKTLNPSGTPISSSRFTLASPMTLSSLNSELRELSPYTSGNSSPGSSSTEMSLGKSHLPSHSSVSDLTYHVASNIHNKTVMSGMKKEISELKSKIHDLRRKVSEQERVALEQNRILSEQTTKLIRQEAKQNEINRKIVDYEQRFTELFSVVDRLKEESENGSNNWQSNNKNKIYVSHTVTSTPAIAPLFVTGGMVQPNLVPLNLAAAQISPSPYLTSSQLGAYPSSNIAYSLDPGSHQSTSRAIYSTSSLNVSQSESSHGALSDESLPSSSSQNTGERASREESSTEMRPPKAPLKKRSKRKSTDISDNCQETFVKKGKMEEKK